MKRLQGFILGVIFTAILFYSLPTFAESIKVLFNSTKIAINGQETKINTLSYNGCTYIKAFDVSIAFGKEVKWEPKTSTFNIIDTPVEQNIVNYSDGSKYIGEIDNGKANGRGIHIWPDNSYHAGTFINGTYQGLGYSTYSDGSLIFGDWINGKFEGSGYMMNSDGSSAYIKVSNQKLIDSLSLVKAPNYPANSLGSSTQIIINYPLYLYSDEDKSIYLGKLVTNEFDSESIYNEFGTYGSKFNVLSIWNEFSIYGSKFSTYSAFNQYALNPPFIVDKNGYYVGRLTVNSYINGAISPDDLYSLLQSLGQ